MLSGSMLFRSAGDKIKPSYDARAAQRGRAQGREREVAKVKKRKPKKWSGKEKSVVGC
jgi:hypothetical protein